MFFGEKNTSFYFIYILNSATYIDSFEEMYGKHATATRKLAQESAKEAVEAEKVAKENEKMLREIEAEDLNIYRSKYINDMGSQDIMTKYNKTLNQLYAALRRHERRLDYTR